MDNRDVILRFLLDNKGNSFSQRDLKKRILNNLNEDEIKNLLYKIINYKQNLIHAYKEYKSGILPVESTGLIKGFLDKGGFTKIEQDLALKSDKDIYSENLQLEINKLQKDNLNYQQSIRGLEEELKISSLLKNWWWLIVAAIGSGVAIGKLLV